MQISLGPLMYCWPKSNVYAFYEKVAESDIPLVYLGETVCTRRRQVKWSDYLALAKLLQASGKQVILSTLALIENSSELTELRKQIANGEFMIEANDMAAVAMARELKLPFVCGPSLNNYNRATLDKMATWGMQRFVMPVDLSRDWLRQVSTPATDYEVEVIGYGHLPLAHSARCFTARLKGLAKDGCDMACVQYPRGVLAQTQEHQPLLRLNGIQTQSAACCDLRQQFSTMATMGVSWFRVSPFSDDCIAVASALMAGEIGEVTTDACNGYWYGEAGMKLSVQP
ncbi:U32 family peptidase [Shewanella dokdonensis]|uniref:Ubiquinone biosynthesis protein UbiV n=1 Tax=Shewanella dokdonensis TaxID=712036 RepID=A0ABX8DD22_9GAMM|nr:U32 family peptidase [Shewanella dokdonensis]MCL1073605.1 U32 family peptidase [Shewanella dokdonensis]QVK22644.1 U32 family peptidase [Shewanella dokdonensis]